MRISAASEPGSPDIPNEDWFGCAPGTVVVLDGVTVRPGMESGCFHGTPWYVRHLGISLLDMATAGVPLADALAASIACVAAFHGGTCDLDTVAAPSAAVAVLHLAGDRAEYLVLADTTVLIETGSGIKVISDDRVTASVAGVDPGAPDVGEQITARRNADRNRPGGYWVAAADPEAARHAVTGSVTGVRRAAVMTDGAARLADMFGVPWAKVLEMDPADLIAEVRHHESYDGTGGVTRGSRSATTRPRRCGT